jgi:hypothetical protein
VRRPHPGPLAVGGLLVLALLLTAAPSAATDGSGAGPTWTIASAGSGATGALAGGTSAELPCYQGTCLVPGPQRVLAGIRSSAGDRRVLARLAIARLARVGERQIGLRILQGMYATVSLTPMRPLDPVPSDLSATDRVRLGFRYQIDF